jgi:hypothetical protein
MEDFLVGACGIHDLFVMAVPYATPINAQWLSPQLQLDATNVHLREVSYPLLNY